MSGKSAPAAPPEGSWVPAEKENGSPAASPPKKKKPKSGSSSLRRAFSWLRGRRKKAAAASQPGAPPAEGKRQEERRKGKGAATKAENEKWLSVQYKAVEEQPDNVFFPSTRPPHLEELHIQAQAGLKSLQNQEKQKKTRKTWDHSETSSIQSSQSTEGDDVSIQSQASSCATENATEDALSVRSEMIQRKGSTFRPHDSFPKSSGKGGKRRRERRSTVLGLPQHVQEELGLSNGRDSKKRPGSIAVRAGPAPQPLVNGNQLPGPAIQIPTIDGKPLPAAHSEGGARISLQALEAHASEAALQQHINRVYYDDSVLGHRTAAKLSPVARPKSLAVPWMTTQPSSPELLSPVMSISPQGTYLSKIIPNAILPPMVDVIALSQNRVRTLSRCSLASTSPALSVRSTSHFPAAPRSREHSSSSDNWSHSQSTETIVSNASTISSHGGPGGQKDAAGLSGAGPPAARPDPDRLTSVHPASSARVKAAPASPSLLGVRPSGSSGRASPTYSTGSVAEGSDDASVRSDRSSTRSVSLRKMKVAPLPPRRTYSLHQKAQQLEAEGAPRGMGLPPKPERRPPREGAERPGLADEDDVFSPTCRSGTSSLQSNSPACSPDISHRSPVTVGKLQEADGIRGSEAQEPGSPDRFGRTVSPSSGYSSQSGTPTLHPKGPPLAHAASPGKKRPQPKKPERVCSLRSPGPPLPASSLTSLSSSASDPAPPEGAVPATAGPLPGSSPAAPRHADRFVIPPHPKVPAPFSPPPTEPKSKEGAVVSPRASSQAPKQPSPLAQKGSPPPSPPPAYHPPPPPTRRAELSLVDPGATPVPSETGPGASADPLWLPPPPPLADEPDLSMADFPPPDEACFPPPPPLLQTESAEPPPAEAGATEGPPGPQRAAPAGQESGAPPSSLSFSTKVSAKILQQGVPGSSPPPAPNAELRPLPNVSPKREPSGSPLGPRNPSVASGMAAPPPSNLPTQIKKPSNGSHPDLKREPAARSKGNSVPKEDASLPIVTPSLLQMVRLRSVDVDAHGPVVGPAGTKSPTEPDRPNVAANGKTGPSAPQKPLRKSLSLRGGRPALKEAVNPMHEAVRLKAATLSSREAASLGMAERKTGNRAALLGAPAAEANNGPVSPLHKSPASTASFIFAKSPKKLVVETAASSEAQASLQKSLVAELMTVSSQRSTAAPGLHQQGSAKAPKPQKVPPPIAKKPSLGLGHRQSPQSPKSPGAEDPEIGGRTKNVGFENQALPVEPRDDRLQSPTAQDVKEEAA